MRDQRSSSRAVWLSWPAAVCQVPHSYIGWGKVRHVLSRVVTPIPWPFPSNVLIHPARADHPPRVRAAADDRRQSRIPVKVLLQPHGRRRLRYDAVPASSFLVLLIPHPPPPASCFLLLLLLPPPASSSCFLLRAGVTSVQALFKTIGTGSDRVDVDSSLRRQACPAPTWRPRHGLVSPSPPSL